MKTNLLVAALAAGTTIAAFADDSALLIRNVSVVDVERSGIAAGRDVLIAGERIELIGTTGSIDRPDARVIDGAGLYLMPGLFDAHVHLTAGADTFGPMLLANGVTCVRDTGASTEYVIEMRAAALRGEGDLPQIVCTGAIIDGDPPVWPFSEPCDEPEEARAAVRKLAEAGVDQIKVYSLLKEDVFRAAVDEAHTLGLKATGHVPREVTLEEAMDAGQDCVEHLTGYEGEIAAITGWKPPEGAASPWVAFGAWADFSKADPDRVRALAARIAKAGMHQCPTIIVMKGIGHAAHPDAAAGDPHMDFVPHSLRSFWSGPQYAAMGRHMDHAVKAMQSMVGYLHEAGVPLMVGTDLANPYVFAGFAVHEEMALFQEAGIPAADVIRSATIVPAKFCGVDGDLGTVEDGKVASLLLVRGNPLEDVKRAAEIEAVFYRGRYLDRKALDGLLEGVRSGVAATLPVADAGALELPGREIARGRYLVKFQEFDAGWEDFVITADDSGYHVKAHNRPQGGPQAPFVVTYHMGPRYEFQGAEWRRLTGESVEATYQAAGGKITATARQGGAVLPEQTLEIPADGLLSGPAYALEFAAIGAAGLAVGETRSFTSIGFGMMSWQLMTAPYTMTRNPDTTLHVDGEAVPARHYTSTLVTDWGNFTGESWTDESGVMLKSVSKMPFGTITVRLDGVE